MASLHNHKALCCDSVMEVCHSVYSVPSFAKGLCTPLDLLGHKTQTAYISAYTHWTPTFLWAHQSW